MGCISFRTQNTTLIIINYHLCKMFFLNSLFLVPCNSIPLSARYLQALITIINCKTYGHIGSLSSFLHSHQNKSHFVVHILFQHTHGYMVYCNWHHIAPLHSLQNTVRLQDTIRLDNYCCRLQHRQTPSIPLHILGYKGVHIDSTYRIMHRFKWSNAEKNSGVDINGGERAIYYFFIC